LTYVTSRACPAFWFYSQASSEHKFVSCTTTLLYSPHHCLTRQVTGSMQTRAFTVSPTSVSRTKFPFTSQFPNNIHIAWLRRVIGIITPTNAQFIKITNHSHTWTLLHISAINRHPQGYIATKEYKVNKLNSITEH
jgi:hypothetical protein